MVGARTIIRVIKYLTWPVNANFLTSLFYRAFAFAFAFASLIAVARFAGLLFHFSRYFNKLVGFLSSCSRNMPCYFGICTLR